MPQALSEPAPWVDVDVDGDVINYEHPDVPPGSVVAMDGALWLLRGEKWWVDRDWQRLVTLNRGLDRMWRFGQSLRRRMVVVQQPGRRARRRRSARRQRTSARGDPSRPRSNRTAASTSRRCA